MSLFFTPTVFYKKNSGNIFLHSKGNHIPLLIFSFILIISSYKTFSQTYPPAVEVWSEPVRVDSLSERFIGEWSPSLTTDYNKLYLFKTSKIAVSEKIDSSWSLPVYLNSNVNNGSPIRNPSISKDSKRLYYSRWGGYGSWDLWYSKWDTVQNDWGASINLGPTVNGPWGDYFAYELSEDTLYCVNDRWAGAGVGIYTKESPSDNWQIVDSSNYLHPFGFGHIRGLSITSDSRKSYFSYYVSLLTDSIQSELFVTYWDTLSNHWGEVYELNINSNAIQPDTNNNFRWIGGWDENPWIAPNGKLLFFHSNRDAAREDSTSATDIYVSFLLIDDNGNPVNVENDESYEILNLDYLLFQNYPNPFNSETQISFYLKESASVSLKIYNVLGEEVMKIIDQEYYSAGLYSKQISFNTHSNFGNLSSGTYIYVLETADVLLSKKLTYLK